jgi:hypothetical protein
MSEISVDTRPNLFMMFAPLEGWRRPWGSRALGPIARNDNRRHVGRGLSPQALEITARLAKTPFSESGTVRKTLILCICFASAFRRS